MEVRLAGGNIQVKILFGIDCTGSFLGIHVSHNLSLLSILTLRFPQVLFNISPLPHFLQKIVHHHHQNQNRAPDSQLLIAAEEQHIETAGEHLQCYDRNQDASHISETAEGADAAQNSHQQTLKEIGRAIVRLGGHHAGGDDDTGRRSQHTTADESFYRDLDMIDPAEFGSLFVGAQQVDL